MKSVAMLDLTRHVSYSCPVPSLAEIISAKPLRTMIVLSAALFLSGNWILPLMDRDEPKFAEASREMLERSDYLIPWFNGQYRFDKPPLIYWCQAASYRLFGQSAFSARLPSAIFATATAALLILWGRRLGNEKAGLYAAIIFVTCLQVLIHARLAVADMPMIFFVAAATWSGWEMTRPRAQGPAWWWMFYICLAFGFLAKGPVACLPLAGVLFGRWLRPTEFQLSLRNLLIGIVLALLLIGLWGVPALATTQALFFTVGIGHHVVFRSLGIMEGHGGPGWLGFLLTLPLYLVTFFVSFFPWALSMPRTIRDWWPLRNVDPLGWYLLIQATLVFAVFTLVRTKLPHYTLPAFPAISFWLALRITNRPDSARWLKRRAAAMCVLAALVTLGLFRVVQPKFVAATLFRQARSFCSPNMQFATIDFDEPSLVWEFRKVTTNYMQHLTRDQAKQFLQEPGPRMLFVTTKEFTGELTSLGTSALTVRSTGIDTARFRKLDLVAVVKPGK
jgi:4-amino-4-deoxy-L-arabinose transferase-like glycosyltransferase